MTFKARGLQRQGSRCSSRREEENRPLYGPCGMPVVEEKNSHHLRRPQVTQRGSRFYLANKSRGKFKKKKKQIEKYVQGDYLSWFEKVSILQGVPFLLIESL